LARAYPALDIAGGEYDRLAASLDDFSPTAIEECEGVLRVYFATAAHRDRAQAALTTDLQATAVDVSDEDWARRSQADLQPVTVGRITVAPGPEAESTSLVPSPLPSPEGIGIVIPPSMGFGTGHHATTRLCLAALQTIAVAGKRVLDVGTGSGILAIAADRLGASAAIGIDIDADAVRSARESLTLNPEAQRTRFDVADLADAGAAGLSPPYDVVVANLTAWLLERSASRLLAAVAPRGILILSGLQTAERDAVADAFQRTEVVWECEEQSWVALAMKKL
jgi:ribosomal protein L11 methyltransferase